MTGFMVTTLMTFPLSLPVGLACVLSAVVATFMPVSKKETAKSKELAYRALLLSTYSAMTAAIIRFIMVIPFLLTTLVYGRNGF